MCVWGGGGGGGKEGVGGALIQVTYCTRSQLQLRSDNMHGYVKPNGPFFSK